MSYELWVRKLPETTGNPTISRRQVFFCSPFSWLFDLFSPNFLLFDQQKQPNRAPTCGTGQEREFEEAVRQTEIKIQVQPAEGKKCWESLLKKTDLAVHSKIPIFKYTI